jgi:hypothetical protein
MVLCYRGRGGTWDVVTHAPATQNVAVFLSVLTEELKAARGLAASDPQFAPKAVRLANGLLVLRTVLAAAAAQQPSATVLALVRGASRD